MVTLIIVPVFYSIFVFDLKIVRWEDRAKVATAELLLDTRSLGQAASTHKS
jgi:hypothetical protein